MDLGAPLLGGCPLLTPPSHSLPLPALSPYLIILDALHGELVAVHPQSIAEDGQPVKLLQLKGLGEKQGRGGGGLLQGWARPGPTQLSWG